MAPDRRLVVYQAPAELMDGLDRRQAAQLAGVLGDAGLVCDILGPDDDFDPGVPECEVALVVADDAPIGDVAALVTVLLGVDAATAREIVCSSRAVLLGHVSAAAVDEGQWQLDKASMVVTDLMSGQRLLRDLDTGALIDESGNATGTPQVIDSRGAGRRARRGRDVVARGHHPRGRPQPRRRPALSGRRGGRGRRGVGARRRHGTEGGN